MANKQNIRNNDGKYRVKIAAHRVSVKSNIICIQYIDMCVQHDVILHV